MSGKLLKTIQFVKEKRKAIFYAILFIAVLAFLTFSSHGLLKRYETARENAALEQKIKAERAEQDSLRSLIEELKTDKHEIERIAREHYGMIKPGEKVYILKPKPKQENKK